jgi:NAD(P)-dependent dehydrogenase (short-subunit alcohol dehydrogenase family)
VLGARRVERLESLAEELTRRGGFAVYAATKQAVRALSEGLRQEVKPYNIRTTVISPGAVATELPNSIIEPDIAERIHKFYKEIAIPPSRSRGQLHSPSAKPRQRDMNQRVIWKES